MIMIRAFVVFSCFFMACQAFAQTDSTAAEEEEFDFSDFELAAEPPKAFCNNKVLGQNPTALINVYYDFQSPHTIEAEDLYGFAEESANIQANHGFGFAGNFPILSRNSILVNLGVQYKEHYYAFENDNYVNPLLQNLSNHPLRRTALNLTVFKPLNDRRFLLAQLGSEINGDHDLFMYDLNDIRVPGALIYGFKPSDKLMWGIGASRTYLGGALNYLPVIYYYHSFKNQNFGIEAVFPSRASFRCRLNSKTIINTGYSVSGASYQLRNFRAYEAELLTNNDQTIGPPEGDIELRRSELRIGASMYRALSNFVWMNLEVGARANWLFNVDEGDFYRGFDDSNFYMENNLGTPVYVRINLSYVSP